MKKTNIFWMNSLIALASLSFAISYRFWWPLVLMALSLAIITCHKELWKPLFRFVVPAMAFLSVYLTLVPHSATLNSLFQMMDSHYSVRDQMMGYITNNYSTETKGFIYMLLFNQKDNKFYKDLINLNIAHLFVVSGLHISIFCIVTKKIVKNKYASLIVNMLFTLFIFYLTRFSISILRVFVALILGEALKDKFDSFQRTCIGGIIMLILFPFSCTSMSFALTMICTLFITYVINETDSRWLQFVIINFFTGLIILPITLSFNSKTNALYFLNNILFSNAIIIIYYFELLTCWIPFMFSINTSIINVVKSYMVELSDLQSFFYIKIDKIMIVGCYAILFSLWNYYEYKQNVYNMRNILYNNVYANNY